MVVSDTTSCGKLANCRAQGKECHHCDGYSPLRPLGFNHLTNNPGSSLDHLLTNRHPKIPRPAFIGHKYMLRRNLGWMLDQTNQTSTKKQFVTPNEVPKFPSSSVWCVVATFPKPCSRRRRLWPILAARRVDVKTREFPSVPFWPASARSLSIMIIQSIRVPTS